MSDDSDNGIEKAIRLVAVAMRVICSESERTTRDEDDESRRVRVWSDEDTWNIKYTHECVVAEITVCDLGFSQAWYVPETDESEFEEWVRRFVRQARNEEP